jgi:hypothetical protein
MTTDDWSPPTDEYERPSIRASVDRPQPVERDWIDPVLGISERDLLLVEAFYHNLGVEASEDPSPPTPDEQESIDWLGAQFEKLKAMTEDELAALAEERAQRRR